jgi:hypothetical protein
MTHVSRMNYVKHSVAHDYFLRAWPLANDAP